jgi:hypothetical protein
MASSLMFALNWYGGIVMRIFKFVGLAGVLSATAVFGSSAHSETPVPDMYVIEDGCGQFLCVGQRLNRAYPPDAYFETVGQEACSEHADRRVDVLPSEEGDICTSYHGDVSRDCKISLFVYARDKEIYRMVERSTCDWSATQAAIENWRAEH